MISQGMKKLLYGTVKRPRSIICSRVLKYEYTTSPTFKV